MTLVLINCKECMKGEHNICKNPETCLCASDNHGVKVTTLKDGVLVRDYMDFPKDEPMKYEQAQRDAERLKNFQENGLGNNSPSFVLVEMTKLLIVTKHMVSKFDLVDTLIEWCKKYRVEISEIDDAIETVFSDIDMFEIIKKTSNFIGQSKKITKFDKSQIIEAGEWLIGCYHIKRIELTGNLLFFNGKYYETDAEALIRRNFRIINTKCKTNDVTEVVKYIEDTCKLITWKDIEHSIHLKCMLNGIYDIKSGVFSIEFNPEYIILNQIPHNYNELATFEDIEKTVTTLIPDEKHRQSYFDFLSSCFHPYTGIDFQFGMLGRTGSGKSQLGKLAMFVMGDKNFKEASIHLIANDQTTQKDTAFVMLNIDNDLSHESIKHIDVLKKWITQDGFTGRRIYEYSSTFRPMSRLMFMANDLYEIPNSDDADAIYDRTYIIRVDKKFRHQSNEVKRIMEKTATVPQLEGFTTYLLKNATWMHQNEKYHFSMSVNEVEDVWNTFGNRIKMFIEKWIERGVFRTESSEPYNKWIGYAITKGYKSRDKKQFKAIFEELIGNTPTKTRKDDIEIYAYTGFRIKSDEEIAEEETTPFIPKNEEALKALFHSRSIIFSKLFENIRENQKGGAIRALGMESSKKES